MKRLFRLAALTAVVVALGSPSFAGQVRLEIRDGLVTLDARDATVREILAEWARVGRTRIVNGERAPGSLLTLQLTDVPEKKALDIVLRASAGYIAASRPAAVEGGSQYDRIVVMAVPRPAPASGAAVIGAPPSPMDRNTAQGPRGMPDRGNVYPPQPGVMVDDQDQPVVQPQPTTGMPGTTAQPGMPTAPPQAAPYYQPGAAAPPGGTPGTFVPAPQQQNRPGMPTAPPKPPGNPGGQGGEGGQGGQPGPGGY